MAEEALETAEVVPKEVTAAVAAPEMAAETPNSCAMVSKRETRWKWMADDGDGWPMMKMMMDGYG